MDPCALPLSLLSPRLPCCSPCGTSQPPPPPSSLLQLSSLPAPSFRIQPAGPLPWRACRESFWRLISVSSALFTCCPPHPESAYSPGKSPTTAMGGTLRTHTVQSYGGRGGGGGAACLALLFHIPHTFLFPRPRGSLGAGGLCGGSWWG